MQQNQRSLQGKQAGVLIKFTAAGEEATDEVVDFSNSDEDDIAVLGEDEDNRSDDRSERKAHESDEDGAGEDASGAHARELRSKAPSPKYTGATWGREEDSEGDATQDGDGLGEEDQDGDGEDIGENQRYAAGDELDGAYDIDHCTDERKTFSDCHGGGGGEGDLDDDGDDVDSRFGILRAPPASRRGMVQTLIVRDRSGMNRLFPQYSLFLQGGAREQHLLFASKQAKNKTSNYHIFDMTRGCATNRLSKKSGNYVGKLRSNFGKGENVICSNHATRHELGAVLFNKPGLMEQMRDGSTPRKMVVVVPEIDQSGVPHAQQTQVNRGDGRASASGGGKGAESVLADRLRRDQLEGLVELRNKDPELRDGNYHLNFHGRVTCASVKNFQLVRADDPEHVIMQFGKVGDDRFHLDYRAPLTALQAFAIILSQFNF